MLPLTREHYKRKPHAGTKKAADLVINTSASMNTADTESNMHECLYDKQPMNSVININKSTRIIDPLNNNQCVLSSLPYERS